VVAFFAAGSAAYDCFPEQLAGTYLGGIIKQQAMIIPLGFIGDFRLRRAEKKSLLSLLSAFDWLARELIPRYAWLRND
jgi:hypothetical protein